MTLKYGSSSESPNSSSNGCWQLTLQLRARVLAWSPDEEEVNNFGYNNSSIGSMKYF